MSNNVDVFCKTSNCSNWGCRRWIWADTLTLFSPSIAVWTLMDILKERLLHESVNRLGTHFCTLLENPHCFQSFLRNWLLKLYCLLLTKNLMEKNTSRHKCIPKVLAWILVARQLYRCSSISFAIRRWKVRWLNTMWLETLWIWILSTGYGWTVCWKCCQKYPKV